MFSGRIIFLAAIIGLAAAEVPSYFKVCGARNPKLDECVIESVKALSGTLQKGIPELDVPSSDPFEINTVTLSDMPNFKAVATNVMLAGLSDYHINSLHVDLKKQQIDLDVRFAETTMNAMCNVTARILVPIKGRGPMAMSAKDVNAKIRMNFKLVDRNGKKYLYFPTMTTRLDINDYTLDFKAENFDKTLQDAVSQALGGSHKEVLESCKPNLEKAISARVLDVSNKICKHFSYDELFPDRE